MKTKNPAALGSSPRAAGEAAHSPTPWRFDGVVMFTTKDNALLRMTPVSAEGRLDFAANAAFIVRACNSHAALVAALEKQSSALRQAQQIIALYQREVTAKEQLGQMKHSPRFAALHTNAEEVHADISAALAAAKGVQST